MTSGEYVLPDGICQYPTSRREPMSNNGKPLKSFGDRLDYVWRKRESMLRRDIDQQEVATAVGKLLGGKPLSQGAVSKWRNGKSVPDLHTIEALAKFFKVDPGSLAFGLGEEPESMPSE